MLISRLASRKFSGTERPYTQIEQALVLRGWQRRRLVQSFSKRPLNAEQKAAAEEYACHSGLMRFWICMS